MKYRDRERIMEKLPFEARVGYVAFCVERCLLEARRHERARAELEELPLLSEALDILWACAERGAKPEEARVDAIRQHLSAYSAPDADGENDHYRHDITLVKAAGELLGGLLLVTEPNAVDAYDVAAALEGPDGAVRAIYDDWEAAGDAEVEVIDTALTRLSKTGKKPFSREVFRGIPEWTRGAVRPAYAAGRVTDTDVNRD